MPRYYFDVRDGDTFIRDEDGLEFLDLERAKSEAARALVDMARDVVPASRCREMAIEVRDEAKEPLVRTSLRFEIQRLR
jgi:hypothetical protein